MQKNSLQAIELAALPIDVVAVQVEHGIGRICFAAEAVVGQHPIASVWHALDARMALQRLTYERQGDASEAIGGTAFDGIQALNARTHGEFAADAQVCGRILRRCDKAWRWENRVACKGGREFNSIGSWIDGLCLGRIDAENGQYKSAERIFFHGDSLFLRLGSKLAELGARDELPNRGCTSFR